MQICHVIASMDPAKGGPPVVVEKLALAQADLGHTITVACCDCRQIQKPINSSTLPVIRSPLARVPLPPNVDVVHMHGVWEPILLAVSKEARRRRIGYIVAPHGMLDPWSLAQKRWKKKLALALGYRSMLNHAAALHLLNEDESRLIDPLGLTAPRIVIPNGISLAELDPPPDATRFRNHLQGPGNQPYILFLSRLHYKKGLDFLADAYAKLATKHPDLLLVVVGPDGGAENQFRQQIEKLGLSARLRMPGPLFGSDKYSAIAGASVFCLPSRQEGFSVAILEAMACRVPVVISDACHFPEVAQVGAGRIVALNAAVIADAIHATLADRAKAAAMGEAGRRLVEERFTWPQVAAQSIEAYKRLASNTPIG